MFFINGCLSKGVHRSVSPTDRQKNCKENNRSFVYIFHRTDRLLYKNRSLTEQIIDIGFRSIERTDLI